MRAKDASLTFMVGSKVNEFKKILPILNILGDKIYHIGEFGSGMSVKVLNNFVASCSVVAVRHVLSEAKNLNITTNQLLKILNSSSGQTWFSENLENIDWAKENYEKDLSYIFDITRSISSKTFYEFKFLNFSTQYSQKLFNDAQDIPFQSKLIEAQELDSYNLSDSIFIRSGYDILTKIPRYEVIFEDDNMISIIDRKDQSGYIASCLLYTSDAADE